MKESLDFQVEVTIGEDETRIVVVSQAEIIYSETIQVARNTMDRSIARYLKQRHNLRIGKRTAEVLRSELATAISAETSSAVEVRARDSRDGTMRVMFVSSEDVYKATLKNIDTLVEAVRLAVKRVSAEVSDAVADRFIVLRGEGDLPKGIDQRLTSATGLRVRTV